MSLSIADFWNLTQQSRLLSEEQCRHLHGEFSQVKGASNIHDASVLAEWLVSRNIFSKYQTLVLLAGRPGPFVYGDYRIYDRIENGRLAQHFRAIHAGAGHPVLLQFITGAAAQDPRAWSAAATAAQVACQIVHPQVQRFHDLVDLGAFKFLVGEDLRGETLEERLAAGKIPGPEACRLVRLAALGLAAIHHTGRAHGDVRPLQMWLEPPTPQSPANVKLLRDAVSAPAPLNFAQDDPHGRMLAQSDFIAPELQMPGKMPDVLSDLYSLGCTLYSLLAGHPPFPGGSVMQKMARHAAEPIRPLETYGVPQPLAQLAAYLMAKNPAVRYQDAATVAEQLTPFLEPSMIHVPPVQPPPTLPAFESAVRQSHARLSQQAAQQAIMPGAAAGPTPAGVAAGAIPAGTPVGAAVKPAVMVAAKPGGPGSIVAADGKAAPSANLEALEKAREEREKKKLIVTLVSIGVALILLILGLNYFGRSPQGEVAKKEESPESKGKTETPGEYIPPPEEFTKAQSTVNAEKPKIKGSGELEAMKEEGPPAGKGEQGKGGTSEAFTQTIVPDDGQLPWASPTAGAAVDLKYVPPDARVFLVVRPADMAASSEGVRVLQSMGPTFRGIVQRFEKAAGCKFAELEQAIVTLHNNDSKFPRTAIVARLKSPAPINELPTRWGNPEPQVTEGKTHYTANGWSFYPPPEQNGAVFLMAEAIDVAEVMKSPLPLLAREVEILRRATDDKRHATVLFYPSFLFSGDGDPLFEGDYARVKEPLRWLIGGNNIDDVKAASVSLHFGDNVYYEMRVQTSIDKGANVVAQEFRDRLKTTSSSIENYFVDRLSPPPYWKRLSLRFPLMVEQFHDQMRIGVEGGQTIINAVLPPNAAHNLVLGTELTIATAPGSSALAAANAAEPQGPKTIEEAMKFKMKEISFPQLSMEFAVQEIEKSAKDDIGKMPFDFQIRILGKDLELDGITRNMSVRDYMQKDKTVAEMLTALMMKATTAKSPDDPEQKLVWVIGEDPDDNKRKVLVTTRKGAEKRGFQLPDVFVKK